MRTKKSSTDEEDAVDDIDDDDDADVVMGDKATGASDGDSPPPLSVRAGRLRVKVRSRGGRGGAAAVASGRPSRLSRGGGVAGGGVGGSDDPDADDGLSDDDGSVERLPQRDTSIRSRGLAFEGGGRSSEEPPRSSAGGDDDEDADADVNADADGDADADGPASGRGGGGGGDGGGDGGDGGGGGGGSSSRGGSLPPASSSARQSRRSGSVGSATTRGDDADGDGDAEEATLRKEQVARLRRITHEKRRQEKRVATIERVLRGVTTKRKKAVQASEAAVADARETLAVNRPRRGAVRHLSSRSGGGTTLSFVAGDPLPPLVAGGLPRRPPPPACTRDPKTGKRVFATEA